MKLEDFKVTDNGPKFVNPAADTINAAAKLVEALAAMAAQTVKLVEQITNPQLPVDVGPVADSQEQYTKAFREWADSVSYTHLDVYKRQVDGEGPVPRVRAGVV